jgi:hypothetical protein
MVSDQTAADERIRGLVETRDQAGRLLCRLLGDRERSEERFAEAGKRDPVTYVTGTSALERAIASTREMIRHLDETIAELESDAAAPSARPVAAKLVQATTAR